MVTKKENILGLHSLEAVVSEPPLKASGARRLSAVDEDGDYPPLLRLSVNTDPHGQEVLSDTKWETPTPNFTSGRRWSSSPPKLRSVYYNWTPLNDRDERGARRSCVCGFNSGCGDKVGVPDGSLNCSPDDMEEGREKGKHSRQSILLVFRQNTKTSPEIFRFYFNICDVKVTENHHSVLLFSLLPVSCLCSRSPFNNMNM